MNATPLTRLRLAFLAIVGLVAVPAATADSPRTRMQPIGAPSAVDRYARPADNGGRAAGRFQETSARSAELMIQPARRSLGDHGQPALQPASSRTSGSTGAAVRTRSRGDGKARVRQAVFQQSDRDPVTAPQLPGGGGMSFPGVSPPQGAAPPASGTDGTAAPSVTPPPGSSPSPSSPGLPRPSAPASDPPSLAPSPSGGSADLTPMPQPQLDGGFATIDNCACISAPSRYSAASGIDCGATGLVSGQPTYNPPPAQIPEPAIMPPPAAPPAPAATTGAPARALFTLGQERYPVQVGQGLWGQPVAYVPDQHVRNWVRYLSP